MPLNSMSVALPHTSWTCGVQHVRSEQEAYQEGPIKVDKVEEEDIFVCCRPPYLRALCGA